MDLVVLYIHQKLILKKRFFCLKTSFIKIKFLCPQSFHIETSIHFVSLDDSSFWKIFKLLQIFMEFLFETFCFRKLQRDSIKIWIIIKQQPPSPSFNQVSIPSYRILEGDEKENKRFKSKFLIFHKPQRP